MDRNYEDLSRRALIALNHDYDRDNDDQLLGYFHEKDPNKQYESIRTVESVTVKVDGIVDTVKNNSECIKNIAANAVENALDKAGDFLAAAIKSTERL